MLYTGITDSMSGPFYATFEEDNLILVWATETVKNDIILEDVEYQGNDVYYVGSGFLVLLDFIEGKDFSVYKIEAKEKIGA